MVAENRDRWRRDFDLRRVIELDLSPRRLWGLQTREQLLQRLIHLRCWNATETLFLHRDDDVEHLAHAKPRECRREEEWHVREIGSLFKRFLLELVGALLGLV